MQWSVEYSKKAGKQFKSLPQKIKDIIRALRKDLELNGPHQGNWPNYSKLSKDRHHCHLTKKGHPTWVVVWEVIDKKVKIIEVTYVGTRERAPY